jgi:hypothetical protein
LEGDWTTILGKEQLGKWREGTLFGKGSVVKTTLVNVSRTTTAEFLSTLGAFESLFFLVDRAKVPSEIHFLGERLVTLVAWKWSLARMDNLVTKKFFRLEEENCRG